MQGKPMQPEFLEDLQGLSQQFIAAHQNNDTRTQQKILRLIIKDEHEYYQKNSNFWLS
jgi:hypothetical protein